MAARVSSAFAKSSYTLSVVRLSSSAFIAYTAGALLCPQRAASRHE